MNLKSWKERLLWNFVTFSWVTRWGDTRVNIKGHGCCYCAYSTLDNAQSSWHQHHLEMAVVGMCILAPSTHLVSSSSPKKNRNLHWLLISDIFKCLFSQKWNFYLTDVIFATSENIHKRNFMAKVEQE